LYRVPNFKLQIVRDGSVPADKRLCASARQAAELFRAYLGDSDREHLVALFLDSQNRLIGLHTIAVGTVDYCLFHPREVFKAALLCNAVSVVLAHNHPSGDAAPSVEDVKITRELQRAAELIEIPIMDHIVLGEPDTYSSFYELGLLESDLETPRPRKKRKRRP
jgi:DNA repair protein RadC